jgi:hypothetical protein
MIRCTHLEVLSLPVVLVLQEILPPPFHLSFLQNLVVHPILPTLQCLVLLSVLKVQAVQVLHQNLDLPLVQEVQVIQQGLIYSKIYINMKLILVHLKNLQKFEARMEEHPLSAFSFK